MGSSITVVTSKTNKKALGIDIGGTRIKTVLLEADGNVIKENRIDSQAKKGPEAVRLAIHEAVQFYTDQNYSFSTIGAGCAGSVNTDEGLVVNSPNFKDWHHVPLRSWLEEDFKVPAVIGNDANCATYTEWKLGNARGQRNAVLLTFGTGVGGGLILNGKLYTGATGTAPEVGHFSIKYDGIQCACGNIGCFERYCSASAVEQTLSGYTAKEIFARSEESPFKEVVDTFFNNLNIGVTSIANLFDPDVILLGGGLSKGIFPRLSSVKDWVRQHAFPAVGNHVNILPTQFANQSGAIGAGLLALEELSSTH